ncbi:cytochrome c oxidase subunit II [Lusitaniella coriacea LEGE 07157]|uniref:Cytochrome c oxidase subunit 2 n=1 Tax=Lusitaniella coriacea LEGE 07157 TaxID=945747 RepID=A0A8J7DVC1_9CYAN|nr:cytochrome c oxidase subunit II [Lusitaniella coriacea]MBE9115700.1 cytochrome c oxidase subunit II [Lusitaniella coriacea LEGE 07157]
MNIPSNIVTLLIGVTITLVSLWYGQNHGLLPIAASEEALQVDGIFNFMMTIATGLFLLIEGALIFMIFRFRRNEGDETDGPHIEGNVPLEIVWTAIPAVIVFMIAIYSFEVYNQMGGLDPMAAGDTGTQEIAHHHSPTGNANLIALDSNGSEIALGLGSSPERAEDQTLMVEVNGIQYAWLFNYPDTGILTGELHIPINREVNLKIKAGDVLHAFWLPEFRIKQDAIPGRETQLTFTATRLGEYPIVCAELCGAYHGGMKSTLYVQTQEEYDQWVQSNTLAQTEPLKESVATNPAPTSQEQFLEPFVEQMGVEAETVNQLHALHHEM